MKLIYLHQYFLTPAQGGGTRSYELARHMVRAGHRVEVVTADLESDDPTWRLENCEGIRVHRTGVRYDNTQSFRRRMRAFAEFAARSSARAASLGGELVFATSTPLTIAIPGIYAARRQRLPFVFEVRDLWPEIPIAMGALRNPVLQQGAKALERFAYANARHVIALSPGMQAGVIRGGVPPERTSVIPNACDFDRFEVPVERGEAFRARHSWLGDRPLIVYAGTLGMANGVAYLAELADEARGIDPELRFLVVGGGREQAEIRARAQGLGVLNQNFFMMDPLPKAEIPDLLSAATIATSLFIPEPTLEHNSANKFFDALAAGRPIALNHGGWLRELVAARQCGLPLATSPREAARALCSRARDKAWLKNAGRAATSLGRERFDRAKLAREFEAVLLSAL